MAEFSATARIPCRPLSTENVDLALAKELLVDYEKGSVWVCKTDGTLVDISTSIKEIVVEQITTDTEELEQIIKNITVEIDGDIVTLETVMSENTTNIKQILEALGYKVDPETGDVSFEIMEKAAKATHPEIIRATILGGESAWSGSAAPYTQQIKVDGILESDTPIIDISLGDIYETVQKQLDSYANIFKILTYDGYIVVYSSKPTEDDVNIQIRVDR